MPNTNNSDNLPEKFIQKLSSLKHLLRLSTTEAHDMRERLIAYADMHAVGAPQARRVSSPYASTFNFFYSRAFVASLLIFILVLGTGTSVTYAAGNSLPGQPLYSVKVNVAEPIQGAVIAATSGTAGSATWENTLAERRITEATTLAAENNLSTSTQSYLQNQVTADVAQSNDDSAQLAAAGNTSAAYSVRTDLAARFAAHAELLAIIAPRMAAAGDATTTSQVATLLSDVSQVQASVLFDRDGGEGSGATTTVSTISSSSSASSTEESTTTVTVAVTTPEPVTPSFKAQEARFFAAHANILSLLPAATASTSLSENKNRKHPHNPDGSLTSSTTVTVTATSTTDSGSDSPASGDSNSATTI